MELGHAIMNGRVVDVSAATVTVTEDTMRVLG